MRKLVDDIKVASYILIALKMLRRIAQKAKSQQSSKPGDIDYSFETSHAADNMVSIGYCEAVRDALSKRNEACERMATAITATQLKMPGGSKELRAVLGGGANIPFASCEVFIGTPSRGAMRAGRACISEKKVYAYHPIEDKLSKSGGSDAGLPF